LSEDGDRYDTDPVTQAGDELSEKESEEVAVP
jgi:hypothetical protein